MSIAAGYKPELDTELNKTRKILERVPEGKGDWKPHPKSMSLANLSSHVATLPGWGLKTIETDTLEISPEDFKQPFLASSTGELVARFDKESAEFCGKLAEVTDEAMQRTWTLNWNGRTVLSMPRNGAIRETFINHLVHHRAQLSVYLRLLDIPVPGMYGPSADEM